MITIEELTQEVQDLAPLPAAATRLAKCVSDETTDVNTIVEIIRYDQALTASVLRYANSPIAGARYKIKTTKDAVSRLGMAKVLEIAVRSHVRSEMVKEVPEYGLGEEELWRHSVASALAADVIVRTNPQRLPSLSFTAALLHDIGKLILARHLNPAIQKTIRKLTSDYSLTYYRAEMEVLKFSHAALGARIAGRWGLDPEVVKAVEEHHELGADLGPVADIVRVSNLIAKTLGSGLGFEGMNLEGDPGACERLGINPTAFEGLCAEVASLLSEVEDAYS